ncbi:MAG: putative membrane protein [Chlamydiales bacterium]|jgi:uncharacterized membrane protein
MNDIPFFAEHGQLSFRWLHVIAGVLWIGILYFFNWVNGAFTATLDAETKKKVVPELMPRALYWFRWGAAWTWLTGVALLFVMYYVPASPNFYGPLSENAGINPESSVWGIAFGTLFVGFIVYDQVFKHLPHAIGVILWGAIAVGFAYVLSHTYGASGRACMIHVGGLFGTAMAANVWMRIWPAQKRIITAIRDGAKPEPADPAMAGLRSKHNTYMSVPLLLMMVSVNQPTITGADPVIYTAVTLLVGFLITFVIYKKVPSVKGF